MVKKLSPRAGNTFKAFTLIEVLVTLAIISLVFIIAFGSFIRIMSSSADAVRRSEILYEEVKLFWELNRAFVGAKQVYLENGEDVYLITSGGNKFKGLVLRVFLSREDGLYEYEFPYPPKDIKLSIPEDELVLLSPLKEVRFYAYLQGQKLENYEGLPDGIIAEINGKEYFFKLK
ncbi:PulJ/GspJ family protein [Aquifex sp.]